MPTDVIMPQMGESIFEGTITKWLKKPGDSVQRDEPLFEISTDKVDAEIPSPAAGTLSEIKVEAGNTVQINTVVAVIGEGDGAVASKPAAAAPAPPKQEPAKGREEDGSAEGCACSGSAGGGCSFEWRRHGCRDAADGRVDLRRHHHQVAEEGGRQRTAG